jgi:RNA polymerase sigma factor (sigma-70 family)
MGTDRNPAGSVEPGEGQFMTTHWSVVLAAGGQQTVDADEALARLCQIYWPPIYTYLRRQGLSVHDAEDGTQGFFAQLLSRNAFASANPGRGRFRNFLLASLRHFLADAHAREAAAKRGGGLPAVELCIAAAEAMTAAQGLSGLTPDQCYDRTWALTLLERVLNRVGEECVRSNRGELFHQLREHVWGQADIPYREIATRVELSENNVRLIAHRLRQRFRELLRMEVAHTVASPEEIDAEIRHLAELPSP